MRQILNFKSYTQAKKRRIKKQGYDCDRPTGLDLDLGMLTRSPLAVQNVLTTVLVLTQSGSTFN